MPKDYYVWGAMLELYHRQAYTPKLTNITDLKDRFC